MCNSIPLHVYPGEIEKDHSANNNYSFYVKNNIFMQIYYVYYH